MQHKNNQKYIRSIDELRRRIKEEKTKFLILDELPAEKVHLKFEGELEGKVVVWNACLRTIADYAKNHQLSENPAQFIKIKEDEGVYKLEVALNVEQINQSVIESTIIMIRKYKRLKLGFHEYGVRSKTEHFIK